MKRLNYCGLGYYGTTQKVSELIPDLNRRVGWPDDTELTLYEEQASNVVQKITNLNDTLDKVRAHLSLIVKMFYLFCSFSISRLLECTAGIYGHRRCYYIRKETL